MKHLLRRHILFRDKILHLDIIITARKRSLRRLCFYMCLSVHREGVVTQHALQVSRPTPRGSWGVWPGGVSRPTPRGGGGKLRGLAWGGVSRPTPRGKGGSGWGVSRPTPRGGGCLQAHNWGVCIPACTEACTTPPPSPKHTATAEAVRNPTGMHSCYFFLFCWVYILSSHWLPFTLSRKKFRVCLLRTSPQYSEMKSFFSAESLRKIPQPATSEGAINKCYNTTGYIKTWN